MPQPGPPPDAPAAILVVGSARRGATGTGSGGRSRPGTSGREEPLAEPERGPGAGERGGRNLPPKPSVAGRKNTWRRWAASRIAGFPRRGGGFLLVIYVLARLLTFTSFQSHLLKQEGKKLLEMAKKSTDDQVASWGQAGG